jgi:ComEC/Rec2-related protein
MVYFSAYWFYRKPDLLTALAVGGGLYLLWNPAGLWHVGFQLSFLCISAISMLFPRFRSALPTRDATLGSKVRYWFASLVVMTLIATIAATPVILHTFGATGLLAIPANAIASVWVPFVMLGGLLAWGIGVFAPGISAAIWHYVVDPTATAFSWTASLFGRFEGFTLEVGGLPLWAVLAMYSVLLLAYQPIVPPVTRGEVDNSWGESKAS